ncbi:hypothetical protein BGZ88_006573 [Linnemannia elongata]|nr:hypothetical protein BGZ88_006573 [Linnemannia elongata]
MATSRGRYSLTAPARSYPSPTSTTSQQQQRPSRREPITITKVAGTPSISSATSLSSSSSVSSSFSSSYLSSSLPSHQHQNYHEVPSAFRRSMSPIGGAAFAVRNFLRRKRGNTVDGNNQTDVDMEVAIPNDQYLQYRTQQYQQQQQQRPSLTMQSFVFVGGADASKTAALPTVIYDIDTGSFSDPESAPASGSVSRCLSPVPTIMAANLSSSPPSTVGSTFSQAMKSRFGRERTPTSPSTPTPTGTPTILPRSSSFRRNRSRNPSAPGPETLSNGSATGGGTGLLAATAASMRKKLNRRSLSVDSVPLSPTSPTSPTSPSHSSLPRPLKAKGQAQAQKLANVQGGAGEVREGGNISNGMSVQYSGSTVGGLSPRPHNNSRNNKHNNSGGADGGGQGGGTVAFQDARNGGGALQQQQGANNTNTESSGGRNNESNKNAAAETLIRSSIIDSSRDGDDDDVDPMDVAESSSRSDELSSSVDGVDMPTPVDSLEDEDKSTSTDSRAAEKEHRQKQQKVKQLQQNSIEFLSVEHARSRPRDGLLDSNPPARSLSKNLRRRSDSTLISSGVRSNVAASRSCVALNTSRALEDLEKEIDALKAKSTDNCRQRGLKPLPRREAKIMLVSSSALPTQFYDSIKTRSVLRTYLTSTGFEFDEMIEYGFPSEAFMNDDDGDFDPRSEDPSSSQQMAAAELAPSCRFLTLRITLTPWHARADESTLYGPSTTMGRQSGNTGTTPMMAGPLSSPSSLTLVGETGTTASPKIKPRTLPTSVSLSALGAAAGSDTATSASAARDGSASRPSSRAADSRNTSRANSRASSPRRDRSSPPSSYRGNPTATTDYPCGSSITPLLPSRIPSPNYVASLGTGNTSQPPRKGSLSALSLPFSQQQQQQQPSPSTPSTGHAPMIPPRRKGSTPALFFTPPPSSPTPSPGSASSASQKDYPSPSSRAAKTYGFSSHPRRPSDQSDTISTSLASARGLNNSGSGAGYLREKASFDTESQNKRQHPRYPHSIHIKQQQTSSSPPSTPSPSGSGRIRRGSQSRLPILDHHHYHQQQQQQQQHPITLPFSEQGSEEQIYECYHVAGLDNIYRSTTSRTQPTVEKWAHPLHAVPHQSSQQYQHQHSMRPGTKMLHISARRDGKGGDEGRGGQLSPSAMSGGAAEQTPLSAAPPRIQAKNQRRRDGSACDISSTTTTTTSRNAPTGPVRRQNYANATTRREEEEMNEYEVHVEDLSFDGASPMDGLEDLDDEGARAAAARVGGYWRPIECRQTSTMKTFAFP